MTTESNQETQTEREPRPIEDLVKLETFQDMTDEEITLVMNYRATIAAKDAVFAESMDIQRKQSEAQIQTYKDSAAYADNLLYQLVSSELPLQEVKELDPQEIEQA